MGESFCEAVSKSCGGSGLLFIYLCFPYGFGMLFLSPFMKDALFFGFIHILILLEPMIQKRHIFVIRFSVSGEKENGYDNK